MPISVPIPIIDQLIHPSLGLLTRVAYTGNPIIPPFGAAAPPYTLTAHTYGVVFKIHTVGASHGYDVGFPQVYFPKLGIAAVTYADLGSNAIIRQVTDITFDAQCLIWDEPLPGLLTVTPAPDVELDLYWLQMQ